MPVKLSCFFPLILVTMHLRATESPYREGRVKACGSPGTLTVTVIQRGKFSPSFSMLGRGKSLAVSSSATASPGRRHANTELWLDEVLAFLLPSYLSSSPTHLKANEHGGHGSPPGVSSTYPSP